MSDAQLLLEGAVVALRAPASGLFYAPCEAGALEATFESPYYGLRFVNRGGLVGFAARAEGGEVARYVAANRSRPFGLSLAAHGPFAHFVVETAQSDTWDGRQTLRLQLTSRMLPQFQWSVELVPEPSQADAEHDASAAARAASPSLAGPQEPSRASLELLLVRDAALRHASVRRATRSKLSAFEAWWQTARAAHRRRMLLQRAVLQLADRIAASALLGWADVTVRRRRQRALVAAFLHRSQLRSLFLAFSEWCSVASAARTRLGALLHALRRLEPARVLSVALHGWAQTTAVRRRHRFVVANMLARRRVRLLAAIMGSWSLEASFARSSTDQSQVLAVAQSEVDNTQLLAELQRAQMLDAAARMLARSARRRLALRVLLGWAQHTHAAQLSACMLSRCTAALMRRRCRLVFECWAHAAAEAQQRRALVAGLRLRQQRRTLSAALRYWGQLAAKEARERELSQAHDAMMQVRLADLDGVDALRSRCVAALLRYNERRRQSQLRGAAWHHWLQYARGRRRRAAVLHQLNLRRQVRLLHAVLSCWRARTLAVASAEALLQRSSRRKLVASLRAWLLLAAALQVQRRHVERIVLLRSKQLLVRAFELWRVQLDAGRELRAAAEYGDAAQESTSRAYELFVTHFRRRASLQLASRATRAWHLHAAHRSSRRLLLAHAAGALLKRRQRLVLLCWRDTAACTARRRRLCEQLTLWRQRRALYACFGSWADTAKHEVGARRAARDTADEHTQLVIAHAAAEAESAGLHQNCVSLFLQLRSRRLLRHAFAALLERARSAQFRRALLARTELTRRRRCLVSCLRSWAVVARGAASERLLAARATTLFRHRMVHAVFHAWLNCAGDSAKRDALLSALDVVAERWCRRALLRRVRDSYFAWSELMAATSARNALVLKLVGLQRRRTLSRCLVVWAAVVKRAKRAEVCVEQAARVRSSATLRRAVLDWARLALAGRGRRFIAQALRSQHDDAARWHDVVIARTALRRRTRCLRVLLGAWSNYAQWKQVSRALSAKLLARAGARRLQAVFQSWVQLSASRRSLMAILAHATSAGGLKRARATLWAWFRVAVLIKVEGAFAVQEQRASGAFIRGRLRSVLRAWCSHAAYGRVMRRLSSRAALRLQQRRLTAVLRCWLACAAQQHRAAAAADVLLVRSQRRRALCCFLAWREAALAEASERLVLSLQAASAQLEQESADRERAADELRAQLGELQLSSTAALKQTRQRLLTTAFRCWLACAAQQHRAAAAADALLERSQRRRALCCFLAWREAALAEASERLVLSLQAASAQLEQESADRERAADELRAQLGELQQETAAEHARAESAVAAGAQRSQELIQEATAQIRAAAVLAMQRKLHRRIAARVLHAWAQRARFTGFLAFLLRRASASRSRRRLQLSLYAWSDITAHKRHQRAVVAACEQQRRRRALLAGLRWWAAVAAEQVLERRQADALQSSEQQRLDGVSAAVELFTRRAQRQTLVAVFAAWVQRWQLSRLSDASERHLAARVARRRLCSVFASWLHVARQRLHWSAVVRNCTLRRAQLLARQSLQAWSQVAAAWTRHCRLQEKFVRRRLEKERAAAFRAWRAGTVAGVRRAIAFTRMTQRLRMRHLAAAFVAWACRAAEDRAQRAQKAEEAALLEEHPARVSSQVYLLAVARIAADLWVRKAQRRIAARVLHAWGRSASAASRRAALLRRAIVALSVRRLRLALAAWAGVAARKRHERAVVAACEQQRRQRALLAGLRWWAAVTSEQVLARRQADARQSSEQQRLDGVSAAVELFTRRAQRQVLVAVFVAWAQRWQLSRLSSAAVGHLTARVARRRLCSVFASWAYVARQRVHWSAVVRNCTLRRAQLLVRRSLQAWTLVAAALKRNRHLLEQFESRRTHRAVRSVLTSWAALASDEAAHVHILDVLLRRALLHRLQSRLRLSFEAWLLLARASAARNVLALRTRDVAATSAALRSWRGVTLAGLTVVRQHFERSLLRRAVHAWCGQVAASQLNVRRYAAADQAAARHELRLTAQLLRSWLHVAQAAQLRRTAASQLASRRDVAQCRSVLREWRRWHAAHARSRDSLEALLQAARAAWADKKLRAAWNAWAVAARGASLSRGRYWAGSVSLSSWQQLATIALQAWASYAKRSRSESRRLVAHAFVGWRFAAAVAGAAA